MNEEVKKRGRPRLSDEERELRRKEINKRINEYHKSTGYAADKRYRERNPEKTKEKYRLRKLTYTDIRIPLLKDLTPIIDKIAINEGLSIPEVFIKCVEEKYNIKLTKE